MSLLACLATIFRIRRYRLAAVPGWEFTYADDKLDWRGKIRLRIWRQARRLPVETKVLVCWYEGILLELILGNDASKLVYVGGWVEPNELVAVRKILRPGMVAVDVGANEGHFSLFFSRQVGATGKVLAIEPSLREISGLRRNLLLNPGSPVIVETSACGEEEGENRLLIADDEHRGQNTMGKFVHACTRLEQAQEIRVATLDGLVAKHAFSRVDFVKIDVEGAEHKVLQGGRKTLRSHQPVLLMEVVAPSLENQGSSISAVLGELDALGYAVLSLGINWKKKGEKWVKKSQWTFSPASSWDGLSENILAVPKFSLQRYLELLNAD